MTLLLLQAHFWSWRNRLRTRLRRLRQPRYLATFVVGVAYVAFLWRPWRRGAGLRIGDAPALLDPSVQGAVEVGAGAVLTVFLLASWLWPRWRPALRFSEAEVAFLFPAPLERRQVVNYSLLRSQLGLLFGALMVSLFGVAQVAPSFWQGLVGTWIVFSTLQMYNLGTAITRSSLLGHGAQGWRRSLPVVLIATAVVGALAAWAGVWLRVPAPSETADGFAFAGYVVEMGTAGPMRYLLLPGRLLARPALVRGGAVPLGLALLPALGLLAASYLWVIRSDFAFEEASAERAARRAARRSDRRTRRRRYEKLKDSARRPPFPLAQSGRPEIALLWKNLIASGRFLTVRRAAILAVATIVLATVWRGFADSEVWAAVGRSLGTTFLALSGVLFLIGPLVTRSDLRSDLLFASTLKTWPLPGWSLVLGEALAPTLLVSYFQVLLFTLGTVLTPLPFVSGTSDRVLLVVAAAMLSIPLNLVSVLVQAGTVLVFPSWLTLGTERARGLEALGQRLVAMAARLLVLAVAFLPAAGILGLFLLFTYPSLGNAAVTVGSGLATLPALAEAAFGLFLLGLRFDEFDPSAELDVAT